MDSTSATKTFSFGRRLLAWDSFECHIMDSVKTGLKNLNVDQATIPGCCKKIYPAPDVSWNKPFKSTIGSETVNINTPKSEICDLLHEGKY